MKRSIEEVANSNSGFYTDEGKKRKLET
jgi:GNAT superfamily N-acetyltransferase